MEAIRSEISLHNLKVIGEKCYVSKPIGHHMIALYVLDQEDVENPTGCQFSIAVHNSNGGHHALKMYGGVHILASQTGVVLDQTTVGKHTLHRDVQNDLGPHLRLMLRCSDHYKERVEALRSKPLFREEVDHILMENARLGRHGMGFKYLGNVLREYATQEQTAWGLMIAYAKVARRFDPVRQLSVLYRFRELLLTGTTTVTT